MSNRKRKLRVTPKRKRKPDYRKMSAALQIYLASQAEADAEAARRDSSHGGGAT